MPGTDTLLDNNRSYSESFTHSGAPSRPGTRVAVVACMDARLDVHRVLGLGMGDAHVIRNAGGAVTDDVIRSLVVSQRLLGTTEVMLIHHTECGMLTFRSDDLAAALETEVGVRPSFSFETFSSLEGDVRQSIRRVQVSPFVPHRDSVRGFVYDVTTGRLSEVTAAGATA